MKPARPTPPKSRIRLSFLLPLIGFLILAGFASVALVSTLSGTRNTGQLPSVLIGKPVPATPVPLLDDVGQSLDLRASPDNPFWSISLPVGVRPAVPRHRPLLYWPSAFRSSVSPIRTNPPTRRPFWINMAIHLPRLVLIGRVSSDSPGVFTGCPKVM